MYQSAVRNTEAWPPAVELVGSSGSGKSSLLRALLKLGAGAIVRSDLDRDTGRLQIMRHAARAAVLFAGQATRVPSRPLYRFGLMVQLESHLGLLRQRRGTDAVVILDQGPVYLISILQRALRRDGTDSRRFLRYWEDLLDTWSRVLRMVVVLDAEDDLLYRRIQQRGSPHPLLGRPRADMARFFEVARRSSAMVLEELSRRNPRLRIAHLPAGEMTPEETARTVQWHLDEVLAGGDAQEPRPGESPTGWLPPAGTAR
jgi:hypothetical protein